MPGTIVSDTAIFRRADELAKAGARTNVWQLSIVVSDDEFERNPNLTVVVVH
jgi:hypothetical protein